MTGNRLSGYLYAALSSSTFGLAPLFTISLLVAGFSPYEVLAYRWGIASASLGVFGLCLKESFRIGRKDLAAVLLLSVLRAATSFSLVIAYKNISTGVASTIHFMYPLFVALVMMFCFGEKKSLPLLAAIVVSLVGAGLLSYGEIGGARDGVIAGMQAAALSVFFYGGYIIGVRKSRAVNVPSTALTFYVMAFGALFFVIGGLFTDGIRLADSASSWLSILGLAIPATAVSNITLVKAIKNIGPTLTSIFGALEPLTAVVIGILLLGEQFTYRSMAGMTLVLCGVLWVVHYQNQLKTNGKLQ